MATNILMPALSPTMTEGNLAKWLKKEGEKVRAGDVIAEIETDKATMEVEAVDEGVLAKIVVAAGTEGVKVNTPIAVLAVEGEDNDKAGEGVGEEEPAKPAAAETALEWVRGGKGPILLELKTYRYRGHSMSDPAKYRSKDEVQKMRSEHDPIEQVKARLIEKKWASEDELKAIDKEVRDIVADAAEFAQTDPEPDASELWTDIVH